MEELTNTLTTLRITPIQYVGIKINKEDIIEILDNINDKLDECIIKDEFHITTHFVKKKEKDNIYTKYAIDNENKTVNVKIKFIAKCKLSNLICASVELENDVLCENINPHITIALKTGIKAKQSNDVLLDENNYNIIYDKEINVNGIITIFRY